MMEISMGLRISALGFAAVVGVVGFAAQPANAQYYGGCGYNNCGGYVAAPSYNDCNGTSHTYVAPAPVVVQPVAPCGGCGGYAGTGYYGGYYGGYAARGWGYRRWGYRW
jgi:hypothetical protein